MFFKELLNLWAGIGKQGELNHFCFIPLSPVLCGSSGDTSCIRTAALGGCQMRPMGGWPQIFSVLVAG